MPFLNLRFDDRVPIYLQIMDGIKGNIVSGDLPGDSRIPSIRELSQDIRVNPNTAHRAYQELEREGYIYSKRGMGYFVTPDKAKKTQERHMEAMNKARDLIQELLDMGMTADDIMEIIRKCLKEGGAR